MSAESISSLGIGGGVKPISSLGLFGNEAIEVKSGANRLWMHQLYEESILEDHKRRGINQPEVVVAAKPAVVKPIKPKIKPRRVRRKQLEHKVAHKPLPHYAPVFVKPVKSPDLIDILSKFEPLPTLRIISSKKQAEEKILEFKKKKFKKRRKDDELLLLMVS